MELVENIKRLTNELSILIDEVELLGLKVDIHLPSEYDLKREVSVKVWKEIT